MSKRGKSGFVYKSREKEVGEGMLPVQSNLRENRHE